MVYLMGRRYLEQDDAIITYWDHFNNYLKGGLQFVRSIFSNKNNINKVQQRTYENGDTVLAKAMWFGLFLMFFELTSSSLIVYTYMKRRIQLEPFRDDTLDLDDLDDQKEEGFPDCIICAEESIGKYMALPERRLAYCKKCLCQLEQGAFTREKITHKLRVYMDPPQK
ncbi:cell growth regulator with RING finger domain protein [Acrasis kona]|uniref:Cell growth regulator with RING finger domain protein n=1 Tax=Acrasis kona TaxID=1008807 RepID=A0AAW2ZPR6_9EUKA